MKLEFPSRDLILTLYEYEYENVSLIDGILHIANSKGIKTIQLPSPIPDYWSERAPWILENSIALSKPPSPKAWSPLKGSLNEVVEEAVNSNSSPDSTLSSSSMEELKKSLKTDLTEDNLRINKKLEEIDSYLGLIKKTQDNLPQSVDHSSALKKINKKISDLEKDMIPENYQDYVANEINYLFSALNVSLNDTRTLERKVDAIDLSLESLVATVNNFKASLMDLPEGHELRINLKKMEKLSEEKIKGHLKKADSLKQEHKKLCAFLDHKKRRLILEKVDYRPWKIKRSKFTSSKFLITWSLE